MSKGSIRIKRIYEPVTADDGKRVLVDRLWPRGVSKTSAALDLWLADIAPSPELRTWFGHDPARFSPFQARYEKELEANEAVVKRLLPLASPGPLTLLYAAHDSQHNHAVVLAEYLRRYIQQNEESLAYGKPAKDIPHERRK